ncbi:MAG: hypothetical protein ACI4Q4_05140 [Oscillospiraceae bacterium]
MNPFYLVLNPDNTISFNRPLAHAIGLSETILYGALVAKWYYYSERDMLDEDGWFYSTVPDLQESTSLSEKQQKRCIKTLIDLELIKCETRGMPARRSFYLIDDYEKIVDLIERGKVISEEIKPAAYEKNQLKVLAREERKTNVESVENTESTTEESSSFSNSDSENLDTDSFPKGQFQLAEEEDTRENGGENTAVPDENSPQTAWLTSSAERSEQVPPNGQNKFHQKVRTSSAERFEQVPPKGQNRFRQKGRTSSAQREDKSKYNQSKRKNPNMIDKSCPAESSESPIVENSPEELAEKVRASISYPFIASVAGPNFADCAVKAICELMTVDKSVKLGPCTVAPDYIKKTICHVNKDIIMQVSDKVYRKHGKIHNLPAYLKTAIFQQTCEYLMLPQNEFGFEGYAEMRDFYKIYLSM